jgi:TatD DNase family protein
VKWIDIHTHKAYKYQCDVIFIRNAFLYAYVPKQLNYFCSNGLHPWYINQPFDSNELLQLLNQESTIALGEIGLDRLKPNFNQQLDLFKKQLKIGQQLNIPLILHCVKAYPEIIELIKDYQAPIIFHQFQCNIHLTKFLLNQTNVYFSFGKQLFRKQIPPCLDLIPIERIFLETDTSSMHVKDCYKQLAKIKNVKIEALQLCIEENFIAVFGKQFRT